MLKKKSETDKKQIEMLSLDDLVPENHLVRKLEAAIDLRFIYEQVKELYSKEGRGSIDPVVLIKLNIIQYTFGIRSMRQTIKDCEVNMAYRWYLGYGMREKLPHFGTFSKNYNRRFKGTGLFEAIFSQITMEIIKHGFIDEENIFIDGTHSKAQASNHKYVNAVMKKSARFYEEELQKEIAEDRAAHGKKPLKSNAGVETRNIKLSTSDPDSGLFHKGEHKKVFAYTANVACEKHGYILGFEVAPGNYHDSQVFPLLYKRMMEMFQNIERIVLDAGYKIAAIARLIINDGIVPVMPYKRPMTKKRFLP